MGKQNEKLWCEFSTFFSHTHNQELKLLADNVSVHHVVYHQLYHKRAAEKWKKREKEMQIIRKLN